MSIQETLEKNIVDISGLDIKPEELMVYSELIDGAWIAACFVDRGDDRIIMSMNHCVVEDEESDVVRDRVIQMVLNSALEQLEVSVNHAIH